MVNEEQKKEQPVEYKLLIEFVCEKKSKIFKSKRCLVQNQPFKYGLRLKNIDSKNIPSGKIKNLSLSSGEGGIIKHSACEEFSFPELNPGQEIILWWPYPLTTIIKGQAWVSCVVEPKDADQVRYKTFQFDRSCDKENPYVTSNTWGDGLSIRGELEQQQSRTNFLMFVLTLLVFLDGVWGLGTIFKEIFKIFGWLLSQIGIIFSRLGH